MTVDLLLWLFAFALVSVVIEVVVDRALGITKRLNDLPRWKVLLHETMYIVWGIVLCILFTK